MRPLFLQRILILLLVCYAFFLFGNSMVSLTDPDETFYALTAKEMLAKGEWLTPLIFGQPQFEKPIFTYWLIAIAFKVGGITPFAARFFPAVFASLGVLAVYFLGLLGFKEERKAFFSALVLATGGFYVGMGKTVFTDMIFTVFILWAFLAFFWSLIDENKQPAGWIGFYVCCALATLTKGPLGLVIPQATVILFLLYQRQMNVLRSIWVPIGVVLYFVIAGPWYYYMDMHYGQAFIHEFFYNDHWRRVLEAEHKSNDSWYFYPVTMIAGLFPWSLFLLAALNEVFKRLKNDALTMDYLSLSWILVVFVIFQSAHSKLASYILPLFPALAFITGHFLDESLEDLQKQKVLQILMYVTFGLLALLGIAVVGAHKLYSHYISSPTSVYFLSGAWIAIAGIGMVLAFKERLRASLYVLAASLLPVLLMVFMISSDLEDFVSSWHASLYLPHRQAKVMTVITSKTNARGIHYYTGQDVAVINSDSSPFFSPHPIPILDTEDKIVRILKHQPVTYAVVRKGVYQDLLKDYSTNFKVALLRHMGLDYILKIEPLKRS